MAKDAEQLKKAYREFILDCIANEIRNADDTQELHSDSVMEVLENDPDLSTLRQLVTTIYPDETRYYMHLSNLEEASEEGFSQEFTDLLDERVQNWSEAEREKKAEQERQTQEELKEAYFRFIAAQMHLTESIGDYEDYPEERHFYVEDLKALTDLDSLQGYAITNYASEIEKLPYPENLSDEDIMLMSEQERLSARMRGWLYKEGLDLPRPDLESEDRKYQRYLYEKDYKPEVNEMSDEEKEQIQAWLDEQEKKKEAEMQAENAKPEQKESEEAELEEEPEEDDPEESLEEDDDELSFEEFEKLQPRKRSNSFVAPKVNLSLNDEEKDFSTVVAQPEEIQEQPAPKQPEQNIPVQKTDSNEEINQDDPKEEFEKLKPRERSNSFVAPKVNLSMDEPEEKGFTLADVLPEEMQEQPAEEEPKPVNEAAYNQALRELNADLEKTKSVFSSDSKEFTRIKTYMSEISKLGQLDREQLRQVFNLLKTNVEDYQEHARNNPRPDDNWRRNTRLGIMEKISGLADDFNDQVFDPKEKYAKRAAESMIDAMCKKNPGLDRNKFEKAFTGMDAFQKTLNDLSIFELDKIAGDPKAALKLTGSIHDLQKKMDAKSLQAENKMKNEMNTLLK